MILAAEVGAQGLRDADGAVGLLVVLQHRDEPARRSQSSIQRGNRRVLALETLARVEAAGLVRGSIRGGGDLHEAVLGG